MGNVARLTRQEAENFLFEEARLLDERLFEAWLHLFTEDGLYWIPIVSVQGHASGKVVRGRPVCCAFREGLCLSKRWIHRRCSTMESWQPPGCQAGGGGSLATGS